MYVFYGPAIRYGSVHGDAQHHEGIMTLNSTQNTSKNEQGDWPTAPARRGGVHPPWRSTSWW